MTGTLFSFAVDFVDEGVDTVLARAQDEAGLAGIAFAAAYHDARDVLPHNPRRAVYYHEPGAVTFHPEPARYAKLAIKPIVSRLAREQDILQLVIQAADARGLHVDGWLNLLHCDRGLDVVDHTTRNAFGDASLTDLCPADPEARGYVTALAADVAGRGVRRIIAEGLHYYGFDHGYHHERSFVKLGPRAKFLLGLCFCRHCHGRAQAAGIDVDSLATWTRAEVRSLLNGSLLADDGELSPQEFAAACGGALGAYLDMRTRCVSDLVRECHDAVRLSGSGAKLVVMDPGGAIKGYSSGRPEGSFAADTGWLIGLDIADVATHCDGIHTMSYAADPDRIRAEFRRYREVVGPTPRIATVLRPAVPDCSSAEDLGAKVRLLHDLGASEIDFYHYGMMRLDALSWIGSARRAVTRPSAQEV